MTNEDTAERVALGEEQEDQFTANGMSRAVFTAYRSIRKDIMTGELRAGDLLPEKELAERIGVSRTPVREALSRLRTEGLVVLERYRKNYVADFSDADIIELIELRALLEGRAAGLAAKNISEEELAKLRDLALAMEAIVYSGDGDLEIDFPPLNEEFHRIICAAANSPRAERILESSLDLPFDRPHGKMRNKLKFKLERSCHYHRAILEAIEMRDQASASQHMQSHVLSILPYRL
ncbi:MAG: GntR family transcriptional regulator [Pseudomonadota bacterium]